MAVKKYLIDLDLNKNQLLNVVLHNLSTAPVSPVAGQLYYNTTTNIIYFWKITGTPTPTSGEWVDISGNITSIIAGSGLSGGGSSGNINLDINVDNVTLEISSDTLRLKDLSVSTNKLIDSSVTTLKINNNAVTLGKIQQIAGMRILGNLSGVSSNVSEIVVISDLSLSTTTSLATSQSIRTYIDSTIGSIGQLEGSWNPNTGTFPVGTAPVIGTKKGDYWYVSASGTVDGVFFNIGDVIIAKIDNASTTLSSDWIQLEVNRDQSSESAIGLIQIATQLEVDTGTNNTKAVTPLKLKTLLDSRVNGYSVDLTGVATAYIITHPLQTKDVVVEIIENSTGETVLTGVSRSAIDTVIVTFAQAPVSNQYRVIIKK